MRTVTLLCCFLVAITLASTTSRSDSQLDTPTAPSPVASPPPTGAGLRDPFTPYSIGAPEAAIPYEQLSPEERTVADAVHNQDFSAVHEAYAAAVRVRSADAAAEAAVIMMGLESVSDLGAAP